MATSRVLTVFAAVALAACSGADSAKPSDASARVARYTPVALTIDSSALTPKERQALPLLIEAARTMDDVYRQQVYHLSRHAAEYVQVEHRAQCCVQ